MATAPGSRFAPAATGAYTHKVTDGGGRYGFVLVPSSNSGQVILYQATLDEISHLYQTISPSAATGALSGTVSGVGASQAFTVNCQNSSTDSSVSTTGYSLSSLASGSADLAATLNDASSGAPQAFWLLRGLTVGGNSVQNIDFSDAQTIMAITYQATAQGAADYAGIWWLSARGTSAALGSNPTGGGAFAYGTLPALAGGDTYFFSAGGSAGAGTFSLTDYFQSAGNRTFSVPNFSDPGTVTVNGQTVGWQPYANAEYYALAPSVANGPGYNIFVTPGWLNGQSAYSVPNFSGLSGWQSGWTLASIISWTFSAGLSNLPLAQIVQAQANNSYPDGATTTLVTTQSPAAPGIVGAGHGVGVPKRRFFE